MFEGLSPPKLSLALAHARLLHCFTQHRCIDGEKNSVAPCRVRIIDLHNINDSGEVIASQHRHQNQHF